ncbi:hypothetical protein [Bdellovibrio bacteriovorus]|nr:hypothetical protein [Bdellovibrio bacteriovorus]
MLSKIKSEGKSVYFKDNAIFSNQTDKKGDIVCPNCEKQFTKDDSFSALFFRDKEYYKYTKAELKGSNILEAEYHCSNSKAALTSFIASVVLRADLYNKKYEGESILAQDFERVRKSYLTNSFHHNSVYSVTFKLKDFSEVNAFPSRISIDNRKCVEVITLGYHSILFVDGKPPVSPFEETLNFPLQVVPVIYGFNNAVGSMFKNIFENFEDKIKSTRAFSKRTK